MPPFDPLAFRKLMGCFATGVAVLTARSPSGEAVGMTINSFTSVSLEPPLILFCLIKKARGLPTFKSATYFGINILSAGQTELSRHFAGQPTPKPLSPRAFAPDVDTCPLLRGTLGWITARKTAIHPGGDHLIFVAEALHLHQNRAPLKPLIYYKSAYHNLS